jgi:iron(III) transport system substrate-binding protein
MRRRIISLMLSLCALWLIGLSGCKKEPAASPAVVLYTAVDEPVARPIVLEFTQRTGITVILRTDTEATKSVGLAERLEAEKDNPQADVWWGNEVFHTINLADRGVLARYESPALANIPPIYKDSQYRWAGTALRARVIARTTASPGAEAVKSVNSLLDLAHPALKGKICMARPTAGTTGGHLAALYTVWGRDKFEQFLRDLKANNIKLLGGNSVVAEYVGQGQLFAGLTDNDDVDSARREGGKLELILPDQNPEQIGTLAIPCTVGLIAGAKHPDAAKKLIDYLLSPEVEKMLLDAKFARYSVFAAGGEQVKPMPVNYAEVATNLRPAVELAMKILEGRE